MEVHPSVARTFTPPATSSHTRLPNSTSSSTHHKSHTTSSSYSVFSQPSRTSSSTQHTTSSALWNTTTANGPSPPPPPSLQNGVVSASNNVINRVADKGTSLFQFCRTLRIRLSAVPGFEEDARWTETWVEDASEPVSLLWKTFRRGYPLLRVYNLLQPDEPLVVNEDKFQSDAKREKAAVFKFLQACINRLKFKQDECFIISDLFGEDTSGFVKVARVVSRVVDILEAHGFIEAVQEDPDPAEQTGSTAVKRTQRQHIVDELVRTERTYVQHLEMLHEFKRHVEENRLIVGDAIHEIFLNLNALLDFQRRFLIKVESVNAIPEDEQDWGSLFVSFAPGLRVYESYIANQKTCEEAAMRNYDKLKEVGGPPEMQQLVESPTHFTAFLLKPFQRLSKYPLLLKELRDKGDLDQERRDAITKAIAVITSVLQDTNAFLAKQERANAVAQLLEAIDDWKNHHYGGFGELLLFGAFLIQKGDIQATEKEVRQVEYKLYLFENMLLCCKDVTNKRNKLMPNNKPPSVGPPGTKTGKTRYTLKGRIYLFNLEDVITMVKPGEAYMCRLSWLANPGVESLSVRFPSEETMNTWRDMLLQRKNACKEDQRRLEMHRQQQLRARSSSDFTYMTEQPELENPYKDKDDDSGELASRFDSRESLAHSISNQGSSNSLRSRSTTGESGPPMPTIGRGPPMKYPAGFTGAPLTLRTQQLQANSPMDRTGNSYFSPIVDSPLSSRTSSSSGIMSFPRQATPQTAYPTEDSNRFTAPAPMTRAYTKDGQMSTYNGDQRNGRGPPSGQMPMHPSSLAQTRLRSASSPDVQSQLALGRQAGGNAPPVPTLPSHHLSGQPQPSNRSQSNTPINGSAAPPRGPTQSPTSRPRQGSQLRDQAVVDGQANLDMSYDKHGRTSGHTQWSAGTMSPPFNSAGSALGEAVVGPISFKVKVIIPSEQASFILVAPNNISFKVLRDRIDAKLVRFTNNTMSQSSMRLQFKDDGEMISIQTDEDVQTAFDTWRESQLHRDSVIAGQLGEIEVWCTKVAPGVY